MASTARFAVEVAPPATLTVVRLRLRQAAPGCLDPIAEESSSAGTTHDDDDDGHGVPCPCCDVAAAAASHVSPAARHSSGRLPPLSNCNC
ncbi:hypothetical protein ACP4OV_000027 [Aristida adscensionis]